MGLGFMSQQGREIRFLEEIQVGAGAPCVPSWRGQGELIVFR